MPNKNPIDEKLVVKNEDYITALYCVIQANKVIVINAKVFREISFAKEKIKVEYNAKLDAYRFSLKTLKGKRQIVTPRRQIIEP